MKSDSNLITLKNIKKSYSINNEEYIVLNNLNLSIKEGEFLMIMGKSGSGKTSLLNILGFLSKFNEGEYIFKGENVTSINESNRAKFRNENIGFVFQQFNLINTLTVYQNMELPLIYKGVSSKEERNAIIREKLEVVGLIDKINQKPNQLSGGQQQRVAIARALVNNADIIFADEPTGALDVDTCKDIMDLLKELNNQGKTILMVTHDSDLTKYATRVIELVNGVFDGEESTDNTNENIDEKSIELTIDSEESNTDLNSEDSNNEDIKTKKNKKKNKKKNYKNNKRNESIELTSVENISTDTKIEEVSIETITELDEVITENSAEIEDINIESNIDVENSIEIEDTSEIITTEETIDKDITHSISEEKLSDKESKNDNIKKNKQSKKGKKKKTSKKKKSGGDK